MELKVINKNSNGEIKAFAGMKMLGDQADVSDAKTKEIIEFVQALPRVSVYTGSSAPIAVYNGENLKLSFKFYTKEEKATYKAYRDEHKGSGSSGGASKTSTKAYEEACNLIQKLEEAKCPDKFLDPVRAYAETLKPVDPAIRKAQAALQGLTEEQKAAFLKSLLGN